MISYSDIIAEGPENERLEAILEFLLTLMVFSGALWLDIGGFVFYFR
jgi:hypothetical protein